MNTVHFANKIDGIVVVSTENWYRVLNQVLKLINKLIIKPPGRYHLKNNTCIFTKIIYSGGYMVH